MLRVFVAKREDNRLLANGSGGSHLHDCAHHRDYRAGWFLPDGSIAPEGRCSPWNCSSNQHAGTLKTGASLRESRHLQQAVVSPLRGVVEDITTLRRITDRVKPQQFYHLAGQSHVGLSFEMPETTCQLTAIGILKILEVLRDTANPPRFLHASSSEIFGCPDRSPQTEKTAMRPITPYGCAKAFATQMVRIYRDQHGLFACNAISYNHESPRRGENFVTRKICRGCRD
jgi:GDP-mannose 4,6-dehydratase